MPKVSVDVDVANQQQIRDLNAQVILLQTSLERLKTTAQGQPLAPIQQQAGQTSAAIAQVNQGLDVTTQKVQQFQDQHSALSRIGQAAWGAAGVYSTIDSVLSLARGQSPVSAGAFRTAYGGAQSAWAYITGTAQPVAPTVIANVPGAAGGFIGAAVPLGLAAGALYGTNRIADYAQNQILQARSLGLSVGELNNLNAVAAGTRSQAVPGLLSMFQGTDTNNLAWRSMAMRSGISIGKGTDEIDALAQIATKIRQMPSYDQRVQTIQALYPGGDPKQMLDALDANLARMAKRLDEVNRSIDDSALNRLTKFKDTIHDITNIPGNIAFEFDLMTQKIAAGVINLGFSDWKTALPPLSQAEIDPGSRGIYKAALRGPAPTGFAAIAQNVRNNASPESSALTGLRRLAARADELAAQDEAKRRSVQNVTDAMEALELGTSVKYGQGQTLTPDADSIEKAKKWAAEYLDTWMTKGPGVQKVLGEHMRQLKELDDQMMALGAGGKPGEARTVDMARRQALRQTIAQEKGIAIGGLAEENLEDQIWGFRPPSDRQLGLQDQFQYLQLQNAFNQTARATPWATLDLGDRFEARQQGIGLYNTFRNRGGQLPDVLQNFLESRRGPSGQIAGMRRQLGRIYTPGSDTSADVNYSRIISMLEGDISRQQRLPFVQQQAQFGMQLAQVMAEPGQEQQTAKQMYQLQTAAAKDFYDLSIKGERELQQLKLQTNQAAGQYALTLLQTQRIEKQRAMVFQSQMAAGAHGFNLQMMGLTAEPGQEMQGFGESYQENVQFAAEQFQRNLRMMSRSAALQQLQGAITGAAQGRTISETGFGRQRREEARGYDIQDITSTAQFDISQLQLWAVPGQERLLQGAINLRQRQGLDEQIARAGGAYTPRQIQNMRFQQGLQERGAAGQLDRQDYLRQRDLSLEKIQTELQLTSQIVALRNDGEYLTAKKTHELRLDALKKELDLTGDIYEFGKQERSENLQFQMQLNQINAQRKATVQGEAGTLFDMVWGASIGRQGGPNRPLAGVGQYLGNLGVSTARTLFTNTAGVLAKDIFSAATLSGGAIPGQMKDGELTTIGKILQHTFLGVDPMKGMQNIALTQNSNTNTVNTIATDRLTQAILAILARVGGGGGGGGGLGGGWGFTPANWSSGTGGGSPVSYDYGFSPANWDIPALPPFPDVRMGPMSSDGYFSDPTAFYSPEGGGYSPLAGYSQMSASQIAAATGGGVYTEGMAGRSGMPGQESMRRATKGPSNLGRNVGRAVGAGAAAVGVYSGVRRGGLSGGLQAGSSALAGLALIPGPQAPFLAAAALIAGTVSMFLPDPFASRMRDEENFLRASQLKMPDPVQLTVNVNGQQVDYDFKGRMRSYGTTSGLGTTGIKGTVTAPVYNPGLDPGLIVGSPMIRPTVVQNFHLLDTQSLMSRRSEIAEVTRAALDDFHPLRHTIQQLSR